MKHINTIVPLFFPLFLFVFCDGCIYSEQFKSIYCFNINNLSDIRLTHSDKYFYLVLENSTLDIVKLKEIDNKFSHITLWNSNFTCSEMDICKMKSNTCFEPSSSVMNPYLPDYNLNEHTPESYVIIYVTLIFAGLLNGITMVISVHLKKKKAQYERIINSMLR